MTLRRARLLALPLLATLCACGGGGDSSSSSSSSADVSSRSTAQSVTASGAVMPTDSTDATSLAVTTAQAAYTGTVTGSCAGGGSATFSVSGGTIQSRANGVFDAGETFDISFAQCRSASGASAVTGRMSITVVSTAPSLVVETTSTNLSVALPLRTITLNGSSRLTQTVTGSGANSTTTNHWTSSGIRVDSARNGGSQRYDLRNVDYTRNIIAVNGTPVSSTSQGQSTIEAPLLLFPWFITLATLGPIQYGPTGAVVSGRWSIDTPDDHIELEITPLSVSLAIDLGNNGSNELTFFFSFDSFFDAAG